MRGRSGIWPLGLTVLLLSTAGCGSSPPVGTVVSRLEAELPGAEFEPEFHLRLGRMSLGLVRTIAGWGLDEDDEDLATLRRIRRLDIGTYRVVSLPPIEELQVPEDLMRKLDRSGWTLMIRTRDEDECVWLFARQEEGGTIGGLYIVALDEAELTMVSLEGRLDELLAEAIADDPSGFAASFAS